MRIELADEIEKQLEEAANMGEPPSFALRRDQADRLVAYLRTTAKWIDHLEKGWLEVRQRELRSQGMRVEQARIHAEAELSGARIAPSAEEWDATDSTTAKDQKV